MDSSLAINQAGHGNYLAGLADRDGATILPFRRQARMALNTLSQPLATGDNQEMAAFIALVAGQRDRAAFKQIYRYFTPRVKAFLMNRGLSGQASDDVLQEVMLGVWEKAHLYKPEKASVSTWIFTIARYKNIDRMRRVERKEGKEVELEDPDHSETETLSADDEIFRRQNQDMVQATLARLPAEQRTVIFLSFSQGLTHSEIAVKLDLPLGTVKSRIRRAFQRLREELGDLA